MDKDAYENFLDESWHVLRTHLLSAYPSPAVGLKDSAGSLQGSLAGLQAELGRIAGTASAGTGASPPFSSASSVRFNEASEEAPADTPFPKRMSEAESAADDAEDTPDIGHGDSSRYLQSDLSDLTEAERRSIRHRLRIRLGHVTKNRLVTGRSLHDAMVALGLTRYEEEDMNDFLNHLATFVDLGFENQEGQEELTWSGASLNFFLRLQQNISDLEPVWAWPYTNDSTPSIHREHSMTSINAQKAMQKPLLSYNAAPVQAVMEIILAREGVVHKKVFGPKLLKQFKAMREVLMAGDTNRLVAELTFVRINDLAIPPEPIHILMYLEPLIALIIIGNGVMIGFQTDPNFSNWPAWIYMETGFAIALLLEILIRMAIIGCCAFWRGPEWIWNLFDFFLCAIAWADLIWQMAASEPPDTLGATLLRFFRLTRLARIVRVFRLKVMKDLRLMLRGLVAGCWTLALSFVLLFAVLYVIAGLANITMGSHERTIKRGIDIYFLNIPIAMFTAFRCSTGECVTEEGNSLPTMLFQEFGWTFVLGYIASYMLVVMGIFNVILAVYVDITMKAAKENDAVTAEQYARESIRVARATRELLKKFAAAYHTFHVEEHHDHLHGHLEIKENATLFTDDEIHENIEISKELFLLVVQDRGAQELMDDLDLPANRAQLFEVIDADGSGMLHIQELVQGLLKVRGEVNKGDAIAPLLASRSLQQKLESLRTEIMEAFSLFQHLGDQIGELQRNDSSLQSLVGTLKRSYSPGPREAPRLDELKVPLKPICVELALDEEPPVPN